MGRTMPVEPRMEMPPSIPSRGLKVFAASRDPSGTEITASRPPCSPVSSNACRSWSLIICRGPELMAAAPTGWFRPGRVTRPTPCPPSMRMSVSVLRTVATTNAPLVTSQSSPPSFRIPQEAQSGPRRMSSGSSSTGMPAGVSTRTWAGKSPRSRASAAARAAPAAQVPVV